MPNVETLLRDHVTLQVDCMDRLYLNGYVPVLQRPENLWWYLVKHKGYPVPSPVLLKKWVDTSSRTSEDSPHGTGSRSSSSSGTSERRTWHGGDSRDSGMPKASS